MTYKYNPNLINGTAEKSKRRKYWKSGTDLLDHEKYYAWLKHRAQARYRKEDYSLTWEQWWTLWPNELWNRRGRGADCVRLKMINKSLGWHISNVEVVPRKGN